MIRKSLKILGLLLLALVIAGTIYEQAGRAIDRKRLPRIGRAVDIGGRTLNLYCSGEGSPVVIFDTGRGLPGYSWVSIQSEIAKHTRACWFDRAGEGWSDPAPTPQSSGPVARDLHELLTRGGIPGPFVLIGHSLGGLDARVYAGLYPAEVAGMVLVDAAHEDEPSRAPKEYLGRTLPRPLWTPMYLLGRFASRVGLLRLTAPSAPLPDDPAKRTVAQVVRALSLQPKSRANNFNATEPQSYAEAHAASDFGDRPIVVLTRGRALAEAALPGTDPESVEYERVWVHEIQPKLARLSTRGRQVIVDSSGHMIPEEAPGVVIRAVLDVIGAIREVTIRR